jgi:hypothetical protein
MIWKKKKLKKCCEKIRSRHLLSDSEDENQDDRSLLCVRDRDKM